MYKWLVLPVTALFLAALPAHSETYQCNIKSYENPSNFQGTYNQQLVQMASWLPAPNFTIDINGRETVLKFGHYEIHSSAIRNNGVEVSYRFRDSPKATNNLFQSRENTFTINTNDLTFSVQVKVNPGRGYGVAKGTAFGNCLREE